MQLHFCMSQKQINYLKAENPSSASTDFIIKARVPNWRADSRERSRRSSWKGGPSRDKRGQTLPSCNTNGGKIIPFNIANIHFLNRNGNRLEERKGSLSLWEILPPKQHRVNEDRAPLDGDVRSHNATAAGGASGHPPLSNFPRSIETNK